MKRIAIVFCLLAGICPSVFGQVEMRRGGMPTTTYFVVASDAPGTFQRGGPNVFLCPSTNAQVKIQEAIDTGAAAGGVLIEMSPGLFTVSKPSGATEIVFPADVVDGSAEATIVDDDATIDFTTGAFSDTSIGQIYRVSGGQDDGDNSVEDNNRDICFTVMQKTGASSVTIATWVDATNTLTEVGAFASAAVDDWLYISGGTNVTVGWHQIATVVDDDNVTITATEIDDGAGDLAAGDIASSEALLSSEDFAEDYGSIAGGSGGQPTFVRMIGCIQLKEQVYIRGAGIHATRIKLAANQNRSVVISDGNTPVASPYIGMGISHLTIDGNRGNQGDGDDTGDTTFHGECNGILLNDQSWDAHFEMIAVISCDGDAWWLLQPWGSYIGFGWTEFCSGSGVCYGDGTNGKLVDHKIADVADATDRDATDNRLPGDGTTINVSGIRIMESGKCLFRPSIVRAKQQRCIRLENAHGHRILGAHISAASGSGVTIGIELFGTDNIVSGCLIEVAPAGAKGVSVRGSENTITGNRFDTTPKPIDIVATTFYGNFANNMGAFITDDARSVTRVPPDVQTVHLLDSGAGLATRRWVQRSGSSGTIIIAESSNTAIDPFGYLPAAISAGTAGFVQVSGYNPKVDLDDAVGSNNGAVAVGDELCLSNNTQGTLEEAASTHWVVAIAEEINNGALDGGINARAVYILPPAERYIKP
ncbi:hypothetical protein LCGC14_0325860 [marine sediment metagenome]|uniref:Periplasmic copper-binding protein NosD beta helix domain-containing protein n=1 Tax=marine sediment metagenome TaxID=412755 RepID=A0A0F9THW3_9ZZZZ